MTIFLSDDRGESSRLGVNCAPESKCAARICTLQRAPANVIHATGRATFAAAIVAVLAAAYGFRADSVSAASLHDGGDANIEEAHESQADPQQASESQSAAKEQPPVEQPAAEQQPPAESPQKETVPAQSESAKTESDQPLLRFNFRFQPWIDVLNYFAEQADLSLVLDAPPPGTFNYSDSRQYTPTEALDLLNGVLLTKGYTLIRRDRLLLLLNLAEGLPADLIPPVTPEELDDRGKFEFVRATFPLGDRPAEAVKTEIQSILGPFGKADLMPNTKQMAVTETAGKLRFIRSLIEAIPVPGKPQAPKPPGEPEKPTVAVYPLGTVEPGAALEVFEALLGDTRVVHDAKGDQLIALATPSQQQSIQTVLAQMQSDEPDDARPRLEVYEVRPADGPRLVEILTTLYPDARLALDPASRKLAAWATAEEQERIRDAVEQLGMTTSSATDKALKVYVLTKSDPATIQQLLASLLDDAQITVDSNGQRLIAVADEANHRLIQSAVDQLESAAGQDDHELRTYAIRSADPNTLLNSLQTLLTEVRFVLDPKTERLAAWATPDEHETIQSAILELDVEGERPGRQLVVYSISAADPGTVLSTLQPLLPEARFVLDPKTDRLAAWANAKEQETIKATIEQMDVELADDLRVKLMSHPLREADASAVTSVLAQLLPQITIIQDTASKAIVARARQREQTVIQDTIESLQPKVDANSKPYVKVYSTGRAEPQNLLATLQSIVPEARVAADSPTRTLTVWADQADQALVEVAVEQLRTVPLEVDQGDVAVYPLKRVEPANVLAVLQTLVPEARITADSRSRQIIAWAKPEAQKALSAAIERIDSNAPADGLGDVAVYPLTRVEPTILLTVLQTLVPEARVTADSRSRQIIAWAKPDDQKAIAAAIKRIESATTANDGRALVVYPLGEVEPSTVTSMLQSIMPEARFFSDPRTESLLAWAEPDEQETIRSTLENLKGQVPEQNRLTTRVYHFENADPSAVVTTLSPVLPQARMAVDPRAGTLVVNAREVDHQQIASAIDQMESGGGEDRSPEVRAYAVTAAEPTSTLTVLRELFAARPEVRLSLDSTNRRLVAWATPEQHETIQTVLNEIQGADADVAGQLQLEVHALGNVDSDSVTRVLRDVFVDAPEVRLIPDASSGNLIAMARAQQQATIQATIEQLQGAAQKLEVIPLAVVDPFSAELAVEKLFDLDNGSSGTGAPTVDSDLDNGQLLVRGTADQITQIRELLIKMGESGLVAEGTASTRTFRVIRLPGAAPRSVLAELERVWPRLRKNPIRVVTPSAVIPSLRPGGSRDTAPATGPPSTEKPKATETEPPKSDRQSSSRQPAPGDANSRGAPAGRTIPATFSVSATPVGIAPVVYSHQQKKATTPDTETDNADTPPGEEPSPIVVAPGADSLTIASEDTEALDQFEALVRALAQRQGAGRDFVVFNLKSASAPAVVQTLEELFRSRGSFRSAPTIVADERLNALIVQAKGNDLVLIENLLEILDTTDVPETLFSNRPKLIPIEHAKAEEIADVLRDLYKAQMEAASARRIELPRNVPNELASVIEQINTRATGPTLSVSVDSVTNSLIVLAPPTLLAEIEQLVSSLDTAATDAGRTVRVVPLKKASSEAVEQALELLLENRSRRRRS